MLRTAKSAAPSSLFGIRSRAWWVLVMLWALMTLGVVVFERHNLDHIRTALRARAETAGQQYTDTVAARLHAQFIELQFVAVTLLPSNGNGPPTPSPQTVRALRSFMGLHPSLYAFNIQSADGQTIVWSTQHQKSKPITGAAGFTSLKSNANFLLGSPRYAARVGTYAITMRYRVRAPDGPVRYFVGTPYKLNQLLAYPNVFHEPWHMTVSDHRTGRALAHWHRGLLDFRINRAERLSAGVRLPVGDTPLMVDVQWPRGYAWRQWVSGGRNRWLIEALMLDGFAGVIALAWIGQRRMARQRAALEWAARIDPLTGLANAAGFVHRLQQLTLPPTEALSVHCVLVLDLYDFTAFNQRLGRDAGDMVLCQLADRMQALPDIEMVARLKADAFGLLWCDIQPADMRAKIEQALLTLETPFTVPDGSEMLTASIGCALMPIDADDPEAALALAEGAIFDSASQAVQKASQDIDPYGPRAIDVLTWAASALADETDQLVLEFFNIFLNNPDNTSIFYSLPSDEFDHLKRQQARYLRHVVSTDLTREAHARAARRSGAVYAYLGVEPHALVTAAGWFQQKLSTLAQRLPGRLAEKQLLEQVFAMRIERDLMMQTQGAQALQNEIQSEIDSLIPKLMGSLNWFEALDKLMDSLRLWPMLHSAAVLKQDPKGGWFCKVSLQAQACTTPGLPADHPVVRALMLGERVSVPTLSSADRARLYETDSAVRSLAAIPLKDGNDHTLSVLVLRGRLPNQFDTVWMRIALDGLQQALAVVRHYITTDVLNPVVTQEQRAIYRQHLFDGGLRMYMQPLLCLRERTCTKVEALARLQLPDGTILSPGMFLPLLGELELNHLFIDGLDLGLRALKEWEAKGLCLNLSINLPPHTLIEPDCLQWITQALQLHDVAPGRLTLELLETSGSKEADYERAIFALHELGVKLAMDDLGSGYSSLQRLQRLPFDFIKIDQGLVRNLHHDPDRGVAMVGGIVRLARALKLGIVVEGVETDGLMELSALLGADLIQGFSVAKPMPAEDLPRWLARNGKRSVATQSPTSLLGVLGSHWLWVQERGDALSPDLAHAHLHSIMAPYIAEHGLAGTVIDHAYAALHQAMLDGGSESDGYRAAKEVFLTALQRELQRAESGVSATTTLPASVAA